MQFVIQDGMSRLTRNKRNRELSDIRENMAGYFSGCEEVSSVFMRPGNPRTSAATAVAVLVKDAGLDVDDLAGLQNHYTREASLWGPGMVQVEVLNISPVSYRYRIMKDWNLVFERNRSFRTWFFELAADAHHGLAVAA